MHIHSYVHNAKNIISEYDGAVPFAVWLKNYFKQHKKFGSKDRRYITHLCYCYFRLGHAFKTYPVEERLGIGLYLCSDVPNDLLAAMNNEWNQAASIPAEEKLKRIAPGLTIQDIFLWNHYLSPAIEVTPFNASFLVQPLVYLRIRPGNKQKVEDALQENAIPFDIINDNCIAVSSQTKVDAVLEIDKEVVVQDVNSQRVLEPLAKVHWQNTINVWDCCAASGGKSILMVDTFPNVRLTVSDVRQSILHNLRNRFAKAGIKNYHWFVGDAAQSSPPKKEKFDVIICDAPCSGSGTWSRTPEQLHFFTENKIDHYANLQKSIVTNASKSLKQGGYLLYITCSVFAKENEEAVAFIKDTLGLTLLQADYYKGYQSKADTLFAALFRV